MRGLGSGSFDPNTLAIIETAFDEAWLTLKCDGNHKVRADELARCILRLAMEGERDVARLHERALSAIAPAMMWREERPGEVEKVASAA
jgi:hypothetical protein